jgi:hypothetical protein
MPGAKGTWIEMGVELIHKRGEGLREYVRGVQRENYPCLLIQPIFLNFLLLYKPSNF